MPFRSEMAGEPMVETRRLMPYAAVLAVALALAACSSGGPAPAQPATRPSDTTTPKPTTTASRPTTMPTTSEDSPLARIPTAARAETRAGAAAFAAYYVEQLDLASRKGDPAPLEGLALGSCKMCMSFRDSVKALKAQGLHHDGTTIKVLNSDPLRFTEQERTVLLGVRLFAVPMVDRDGTVIDLTEADSGSFVATMRFQERWFVQRLQVVAR